MKTLLDLGTWGVRLGKGLNCYVIEFDNAYTPETDSVAYQTLDEALGDIVNYILNPENVYCMEDQPVALQIAFNLAGVEVGTSPIRPEISDTVGTFLYYVLKGIAEVKEEK